MLEIFICENNPIIDGIQLLIRNSALSTTIKKIQKNANPLERKNWVQNTNSINQTFNFFGRKSRKQKKIIARNTDFGLEIEINFVVVDGDGRAPGPVDLIRTQLGYWGDPTTIDADADL